MTCSFVKVRSIDTDETDIVLMINKRENNVSIEVERPQKEGETDGYVVQKF